MASRGHGHSHGLIDPSIRRSRAGLKAVLISLLVLLVTALAQSVVFVATGSVALLGDLIHNIGDAMTAVPVGVAFIMRSFKAEKLAGYFVVAIILASGLIVLWQSIDRLLNPQDLHDLLALGLAGVFGFAGNEVAAQVRLRAGQRLDSPALVADGYHARTDGWLSLAVVGSAVAAALGADVVDSLIGLLVAMLIFRVTRQSFVTVRTGEDHHHHDP